MIIFLTLTRLVVVIVFENFSFALFTPPLGDFQKKMKQSLTLNPKLIKLKLKTFRKNLPKPMRTLQLPKLVKKLVNGQKLG